MFKIQQFKNKKGFIDIAVMGLLSNPILLLGIAIFVLILIGLAYFMLGKIVGIAMIAAGIYVLLQSPYKWFSALLIVAGIVFFVNPFQWEALNAIPLQMMKP